MDIIDSAKTGATSFYSKMLHGDYGLARTFWLGAVGSNIIIQFAYNALFQQTPLIDSLLTVFVCSVLVLWWRYITLIGTWRACAHSTIHKVFIYTVKALVVFWVLANTADLVFVMRMIPYL